MSAAVPFFSTALPAVWVAEPPFAMMSASLARSATSRFG